ncbi:hypothetical protein, partial [Amycolatopsis decaplanina]
MNGADETTHLPPSLQHFFKVVLGMEWPEGSEGGLKAISHAWGQFHDDLDAVLDEFPSIANQLDRSFDGVTASKVLGFMRGDLATGLEQLKQQAAAFEKQAKNAAADIQKNKIMLVVFAALTLAAIIQLLSTLFGAIFIPVVQMAARLTIQGILQLLKAKLSQLTVRQVGAQLWNLSTTIAKWAAGGAALMVGVDAGIQGGQIASGNRDGWDTESLKGSAIGGAIGGAAAGVFHGLARGAGNFFSKEIRHQLPRGWQKTFDIAGPAGYGIGQVAMVAFSNPLVFLALKDEKGVMWEGILGALSGPGGRGGGVTGTGATVLGQSFLDNLDRLGLGWLKPATASAVGGDEKSESGEGDSSGRSESEQPPPYADSENKTPSYDEKPERQPLIIPEAGSTSTKNESAKDGVTETVRDVSASDKSPLGTLFSSDAPARPEIATESAGRPDLRDFLAGEEKVAASDGSPTGQRSQSTAASQVPITSEEPATQVGGRTGEASAPAATVGGEQTRTDGSRGETTVPDGRQERATGFTQPSMESGEQRVAGVTDQVAAGAGSRGGSAAATDGRQTGSATETGAQPVARGPVQASGGARGDSISAPAGQQTGGDSRSSTTPGSQQAAGLSRPATESGNQSSAATNTQPQWQPGAGSRLESAASAGQPQTQGQSARPGAPEAPSRTGGEVPSTSRTPGQQVSSSSPGVVPERVPATASGTTNQSDRPATAPGTGDGSRPVKEPSHAGVTGSTTTPARPGAPESRQAPSLAGSDGSPTRQSSAVKPTGPLSSRDGVGARPAPETSTPRTTSTPRSTTPGAVTSDGPTRPATSNTPAPQVPAHLAASVTPEAETGSGTAGAVGSVGDPVLLSDVVGGGRVGLSDVDFVSLRDGVGRVVGV